LLNKAIDEELFLSQIKEQITEIKSREVVKDKGKEPTVELKNRIDDAYKLFKRSSIWANPKKQKRLEKLLAELEALASEEP
jgi:ParB family transcriptional regulator, chromosome partitioning protein